jgi:phosphate transport system substrate-binding protein
MLKHWRLAFILALTVMMSVFISACGGSGGTGSAGGSTPTAAPAGNTPAAGGFSCVQGTLQISGSTALQPFVDAVAKKYQGKCSGASITVQGGGSKTGLGNAESGTSNIGNSDLFADQTTQSDLVDHQVAVVIFAVVVNPKVTGVTNLTSAQLKSIYTGQVSNWKDLGGNSLPITVVSRPASSGTRATFRQYILGGTAEKPAKETLLTADTTKLVLQNVEQTDGAIGYAALGDAQQEGSKVTIVNVDGHAPTAELVKDNTYTFWNIEHMYTKGQPSGLAQAFLNYMVSDDAKAVATQLKFVAISDMSKTALDAHQPKAS